MYHFRRNVTVVAIETTNARDRFDGPTYRRTSRVRYSLDAAVVQDTQGSYSARVIHRMGVGRVAVRYV